MREVVLNETGPVGGEGGVPGGGATGGGDGTGSRGSIGLVVGIIVVVAAGLAGVRFGLMGGGGGEGSGATGGAAEGVRPAVGTGAGPGGVRAGGEPVIGVREVEGFDQAGERVETPVTTAADAGVAAGAAGERDPRPAPRPELRDLPVDESIPVFDPAGMYAVKDAGVPANISASCTVCHLTPSPDVLPRSLKGRDTWEPTIELMFGMAGEKGMQLGVTAQEVTAWYRERSPEHLPRLSEPEHGPGAVKWERVGWRPANAPMTEEANAAVSHVAFVDLTDRPHDDLLISDMRHGAVILADPLDAERNYRVIARLSNPAGATVVDLDKDGNMDVVVADLGSFFPSNETKGRVVVLRGMPKQEGQPPRFVPVVLAEGLGRVSDVRAADLDGDGDIDLAVAVFGWRTVGQVMWMENVSTTEGPQFIQHVLDARPGAIAVPLVDIDGDGDLDIVTVFSQEHEQVTAYVREGSGFETRVLYVAPTPSWGHTAIEPVDFDGDGDVDLLVTNGDSQDVIVPKPYHAVTLYRNDGGLKFEPVRVGGFYGAHKAIAADMDGDGDLDIAAAAFVPVYVREGWRGGRLDGLVWFENKGAGAGSGDAAGDAAAAAGGWTFERHVMAVGGADYSVMAAGDYDKDGDVDLITGGFSFGRGEGEVLEDWVTVWKNGGVGTDE